MTVEVMALMMSAGILADSICLSNRQIKRQFARLADERDPLMAEAMAEVEYELLPTAEKFRLLESEKQRIAEPTRVEPLIGREQVSWMRHDPPLLPTPVPGMREFRLETIGQPDRWLRASDALIRAADCAPPDVRTEHWERPIPGPPRRSIGT